MSLWHAICRWCPYISLYHSLYRLRPYSLLCHIIYRLCWFISLYSTIFNIIWLSSTVPYHLQDYLVFTGWHIISNTHFSLHYFISRINAFCLFNSHVIGTVIATQGIFPSLCFWLNTSLIIYVSWFCIKMESCHTIIAISFAVSCHIHHI